MESNDRRKEQYFVKTPSTLIDFIMQKRAGISRSRAKKLITNGMVKVDGHVVTLASYELQPKMKVETSAPSGTERFLDRRVHIEFEDNHIVVVDKQRGILTNSYNPKDLTVQSILNRYFEMSHQRCHAHVVHRLDRDTSGLLIFAKSKEVALMFEDGWKERVYDRRYAAVVHGTDINDEGSIQSWLKEDSKFVTHSSQTDNGGKFALTHYKVVKRGHDFSLVELKLDTGRKNQIRVHMNDIGCPVAGDFKYGDGSDPFGRLALHAYRLCFVHPVTGKDYKFESPIPACFKSI